MVFSNVKGIVNKLLEWIGCTTSRSSAVIFVSVVEVFQIGTVGVMVLDCLMFKMLGYAIYLSEFDFIVCKKSKKKINRKTYGASQHIEQSNIPTYNDNPHQETPITWRNRYE